MGLPLYTAAAALALVACGRGEPAAKERDHEAPADVVELDSAQLAAAGVAVGAVTRLAPDTIALTGTITFDPALVSQVGPRTQGRIQRVLVDVGSRVSTGDTLAILDSPDIGAAQTRWVQARVNREVAARNFERANKLYQDGIVSGRRRLEADAELRNREAELAAAREALSALGAGPDTTGASGLFVLRSPLDGLIVDRHAGVGQVVGPESSLFVVGNLRRVWLLLDVYETDLARVHAGTPVLVRVDAYPDRAFSGTVGYVGAVVDTVSRSVKVRVEIPNGPGLLKPGMFARAAVVVGGASPAIGVPRDAVQSVEGREVVFVRDGPRRFRAHTVVLGRDRAGGWVEVREGLAQGDTVVMRGSFVLKAHLLRAAFGEEGSE